MEAIKCSHLCFTYPDEDRAALDDISFTVNQGELVLLCGESGSGKSTLLRLLKRNSAPHGKLNGEISIFGKSAEKLSDREAVEKIGFVSQSVEGQLVTESVWRELAFCPESLGFESTLIRRKCAETAMYFGLSNIYHRKNAELSGGEKQLVNLAAVMVCNPSILLLDEPTAQLDPISSKSLIDMVLRLNREKGITVMIAEHRCDEIFSQTDRVISLKDGRIVCDDTPRKAASDKSVFFGALPAAAQLFHKLEGRGECPLTTAECRRFITDYYEIKTRALPVQIKQHNKESAVKLSGVSFSYSGGVKVIDELSLDVRRGEIFAILGSNGAGKSTLLRLISGIEKPCGGRVKLPKKVDGVTAALLPQLPREIFLTDTVRADLELTATKISCENTEQLIGEAAEKLGISRLLDRHPYDLSGGEQQKAALAKLLLLNPAVLLLDEPTKGMDAFTKLKTCELIKRLAADGKTIILVTHDVQTAAIAADRCALLFNGDIISEAEPEQFFSQLSFYTTPEANIASGIFENTATLHKLTQMCMANERKDRGAQR